MTDPRSAACRSCGAPNTPTVLDLGLQPVADDLYDDAEAALRAPRHRLAVGCCRRCGLVQLDPSTPTPPNAVHGHGSAFSGTVMDHERIWAEELLQLPGLRAGAAVLDVGSGSSGLLRVFAQAGHRVADAADHPAGTFELVVVNHALSHADDLDAEVARCVAAVAPGGTLAAEFHSATGILGGGQFDVVCHAHRSYLSLTAMATALARHGMTVTRARTLPLHGGVVRLQARRGSPVPDSSASDVMAEEAAVGLGRADAWAAAADRASRIRTRLRDVVAAHRAAGSTVAAYGAPSRGATLLNFCDIGADQIPWTADRSPAKQGRFLPGAAIAVLSPEELATRRPDVVVVLVWPLRTEVLNQFADLRRAGTRFLFPLPEPELVA